MKHEPPSHDRSAAEQAADPQRPDQDRLYGEFVTLLARNDQSLRRFIRSLMPTSEGIDDVMQDTALECW